MRYLNAYHLPKQTLMLLFLGLFVHTPFSVQAQKYGEWELIAEFDRMMWDITFADELTGYVVGSYEGQIILKTDDGGLSWDTLSLGVSADGILSSFSLSKDTLLVSTSGSYNGGILKSVDGGVSWNSVSDPYPYIWDIHFLDKNRGAICYKGIFNVVVRTTSDGGNTWKFAGSFEPPYNVNGLGPMAIRMVSPEIIYVGNIDGTVMKSTDGGLSWKETIHLDQREINGLCFLSPDTGWVIGRSDHGSYNIAGNISRTYDGGLTWTSKSLNRCGEEIHMLNADSGYAVAQPGCVVYKTGNGGNSWETDTVFPFTSSGANLCFPTKRIGYAMFSFQGSTRIFKVDLGPPLPTPPLDLEDTLFAPVWPNPATDLIWLSFREMSEGEHIKEVSIYNSRGRRVLTTEDDSGGPTTRVDVSHLRPGLYFARLSSTMGRRLSASFIKQ